VFLITLDDVSSAQRCDQANDCFTNRRNPIVTVISAPRDDEDFGDGLNLLLTEPLFGALSGVSGRGQRLPEIQDVSLSELDGIEGSRESVTSLRALHSRNLPWLATKEKRPAGEAGR
jgi:hypothetical protein